MKAKRIAYGCVGMLFFVSLCLLLCCSPLCKKGPKSGEVWKDPVLGMEFVWVQGGRYKMGCGSWTSDCNETEKPVHTVCVNGFWIGKYEVTQGQWRRLMGDNPYFFQECGDNCPVEFVSWDEVEKFARKLSQNAGYTFRLPTEAEWEYACRSGGKSEKYSGGDNADAVAWYAGNSGGRTHPVGQKRPNGLGIYDMSGNIGEFCQDWYDKDYYGRSPRNNPLGPSSNGHRVIRGGGWNTYRASYERCASRDWTNPIGRSHNEGFRLVRVGR